MKENKEKENSKSDYIFQTDYKDMNNKYKKEENQINEKSNEDNKNKIDKYKEKNFWSFSFIK